MSNITTSTVLVCFIRVGAKICRKVEDHESMIMQWKCNLMQSYTVSVMMVHRLAFQFTFKAGSLQQAEWVPDERLVAHRQ